MDFDDADTTSEIRQKFTDSAIVRDISDKCDVEAQFASNGNTYCTLIIHLICNGF